MQDISKGMLIEAAKGDINAFERIYRIACDFVFNIAYRITGDKEEAQEVTQDVFLKIYNNLKSFRFQSSFKTWAYRITVNTSINAAKKKNKELRRRAEYNDDIAIESAYGAVKETAVAETNEGLIKSMLGTLNPDQRACVILRDVEGLSYKEIAEALKININTVRSRLKRARQAILAMKQEGVIDNGL